AHHARQDLAVEAPPRAGRGEAGPGRAGLPSASGRGWTVTSPIYVAIDTPDLDLAKKLAKAVKKHAGGLKLGLEFFAANGPEGVNEIAHLGLPVFLDLKLHDIPNTVAR